MDERENLLCLMIVHRDHAPIVGNPVPNNPLKRTQPNFCGNMGFISQVLLPYGWGLYFILLIKSTTNNCLMLSNGQNKLWFLKST
jgi:hypothetical protein